jgi:hypothetical protein
MMNRQSVRRDSSTYEGSRPQGKARSHFEAVLDEKSSSARIWESQRDPGVKRVERSDVSGRVTGRDFELIADLTSALYPRHIS